MHYANLNLNSIKKLVLNYRPLNMLFFFFQFLIYVYFKETFAKKSYLKTIIFNANFQKYVTKN